MSVIEYCREQGLFSVLSRDKLLFKLFLKLYKLNKFILCYPEMKYDLLTVFPVPGAMANEMIGLKQPSRLATES